MDFYAQRRHLLFQLLPLFFLVVAIIVGTLNIKTIRRFLIGALGQNANIIINTDVTLGPMQKPWRNLAQGGESKDWRIPPPLAAQLRGVNTEYIRLDHIYDFYDIVRKDGGQLSFDFTKLTAIINDIRAAGATPYIALSYTPPALAVNGDITAPPQNWSEWQLTVQRTIEHVSGTMNIPNVYYEVWNEPDLFGGYKTYGDKNYLTMYAYAARGAKNARVRQPYKIGGPAITALYKNWVDNVVKLSIRESLPLDFFSWHRYDRDIEVFRDDISNIRRWLSPYPERQNIELHITEWGHDSRNDPGYDGNFGAIHTMAVSTELIGNIDKAFIFEVQDGKDPEGKPRWGRWGIMDAAGQPKPRYLALRFLERLDGQRVQLIGKGSWVKGAASKQGLNTRALLVNYDPAGRHSETVPITFRGLTPGRFQLEQHVFGQNPRIQQIATTASELKISIPMPANSAVFLELRPQQ